MKPSNHHKLFILVLFLFGTTISKINAQDSSAAESSVNLRYFANNNNIQYLLVQSRSKVGKKFQPLPKRAVQVYLDSNRAEDFISSTVTDETGTAKVLIPTTLKDQWLNSAKHKFIAIMAATPPDEEKTTILEITKAKIEIDTSTTDGTRTIKVNVKYLDNKDWVPAKDVEMKIGVVRSTGILSAGDKESYTTDSSGTTSVDLNKDSLAGDLQGNYVLVAKVEDNEHYGNLLIEKTVPWGVARKAEKNFFDQRTLWSTRFRTPPWLLFMAYSIVLSVWGTIFYLVLQIVKVKKMGRTIRSQT